MASWPWNGEWSPVFDREKHIISKYTNIHDSKNPYYTEVLDIFTDGEQEARVKTQQWLTKRMRQKRNEKRQSQRQGEERDRGATNDRLQESSSYGKMKKKKGTKVSLEIQESHTEGGMEGKKRTQQGRRSSAVRQVLKPPAPPSPSQPSPSLPQPPTPPLPGRGGIDMGARWGGDEKKHSTHGWRLSYWPSLQPLWDTCGGLEGASYEGGE